MSEVRGSLRLGDECHERSIAGPTVAYSKERAAQDTVIGKAIEDHATQHGMSVVRAYCGHGIGERFHSSLLQIPHYFDPEADTIMEPGMTFTVEPMINLGHWHHRTWDDEWTAVTADGSRSAQFEHMLLVTATGAEILTLP